MSHSKWTRARRAAGLAFPGPDTCAECGAPAAYTAHFQFWERADKRRDHVLGHRYFGLCREHAEAVMGRVGLRLHGAATVPS